MKFTRRHIIAALFAAPIVGTPEDWTYQKQPPLRLRAGQEHRAIRVWLDGREITHCCRAFDSGQGWALCFPTSVPGEIIGTRLQKRFGRITYEWGEELAYKNVPDKFTRPSQEPIVVKETRYAKPINIVGGRVDNPAT